MAETATLAIFVLACLEPLEGLLQLHGSGSASNPNLSSLSRAANEVGTKKNVRGKTRGINTSRTVAKGSLLSIESNKDVLRVICHNAPMLKSEIVNIVRDIVPITLKKFPKLSEVTKLEIYGRLMKQSDANKDNHDKMKGVHRCITKSLAEHEFDWKVEEHRSEKITFYISMFIRMRRTIGQAIKQKKIMRGCLR